MAKQNIELQTVLDSVYNGIVACDTEGRIILVNASAAAVVDCSPEDVLGVFFNEIPPGLVLAALQQYGTTRRAAEALGVDQSTVVRKFQRIRQLDGEQS